MLAIRKLRGWRDCRAGRHTRDERRVATQDGVTVSRCAYCGARLWRRSKRDWVAFAVENPPDMRAATMSHADLDLVGD